MFEKPKEKLNANSCMFFESKNTMTITGSLMTTFRTYPFV